MLASVLNDTETTYSSNVVTWAFTLVYQCLEIFERSDLRDQVHVRQISGLMSGKARFVLDDNVVDLICDGETSAAQYFALLFVLFDLL